MTDGLQPYDMLCVSHVMSCYPVSRLDLFWCHIGDKGSELLVKYYPNKNSTDQLLEVLDLTNNDLTIDGLTNIGLRQICQHNKKHNRPEHYASIMLA